MTRARVKGIEPGHEVTRARNLIPRKSALAVATIALSVCWTASMDSKARDYFLEIGKISHACDVTVRTLVCPARLSMALVRSYDLRSALVLDIRDLADSGYLASPTR